MVGKACTIKVTSVQSCGGASDTTVETYQGSLTVRGDNYYLTYTRVSEDTSVRAMINVGPEGMTMTQKGDVNSRLSFVTGSRTDNPYSTPVGTLNLSVTTKSLRYEAGDRGLTINLIYELAGGMEPVVTNMSITADYI